MIGKMKVLGITAEYNPFHNGHFYQLNKAKELVQPDQTIIAMSGDFTQRGEPAIADKWLRSKSAILCGADVVFELPFIFACNRAILFASGGVDLLVKAGASHISFGCEAGEGESLFETAKAMSEMRVPLERKAKEIMGEGVSFAKAYETAVRSLLGDSAAELITLPNNILAIEYLKRIQYWNERGLSITAVPIKRTGSGYNDINEEQGFAGASQIRKMLVEGKPVDRFVPEPLLDALYTNDMGASYPAVKDRYFQIIKGMLIRSKPEELSKVYRVGEGIEHRFISEITKADDLDGFVSSMVSRRYTASAVKRMLAYMTLGLNGFEVDRMIGLLSGMPYLRVLAASAQGREQIRALRKSESVVITNVNKQMPEEVLASSMLELDMRAADLYNTLQGRRLYDFSDRVIKPYIEP